MPIERKNYIIMRPVTFSLDPLRTFLLKNRIATLDQLKRALGTDADITVFRKLDQLGYLSSYSDRGRFYTLADIAHFDDNGLWSFHSVRFSRHGTLVNTVEAFVTNSPAGYFASELEAVLHVPVKEPLLHLVRQQRLSRQEVSHLFLYCASDVHRQRLQWMARQSGRAPELEADIATPAETSDELRAAIILFLSLLDEQQRRLYAGLESLKLGFGGDNKIADLFHLDPHTVAKGRRQLLAQDVEVERVRKAGGGRHPVEKKRRK